MRRVRFDPSLPTLNGGGRLTTPGGKHREGSSACTGIPTIQQQIDNLIRAAASPHAVEGMVRETAATQTYQLDDGSMLQINKRTMQIKTAVILYHRTNKKAATAILRGGFRDACGSYGTTHNHRGVWFSNTPLDENEGACGDVLLSVKARLSFKQLAAYEWVSERNSYREWLIPAALINAHSKVKIVEVRRKSKLQ